MSNNNNLSSPDKSVKGDGNSYLDHSTTNTDARDLSTHNSVVNNTSTSNNVDNSHHIHINVQGGDLADLGLAPKPVKEIKEMTDADRERLDRAVNQILNNRENIYESFLPKLKALATEFPNSDKAQYYYYLLLASGSAQNYIAHYKNVAEKTYWLSFWAYTAYKRLGRSNDAEAILSQLSKWNEQSADNIRVLEAYGLVYDCMNRNADRYLIQDAADVINCIVRCSDYLDPFRLLIAFTISQGVLDRTGDSESDFYLKILDFDAFKIRIVPNGPKQQSGPRVIPVPVITEPANEEPEIHQPEKPRVVSELPKRDDKKSEKTKQQDGGSKSNSGSKIGNYILWGGVIVLLVFGYKSCFGSDDEIKDKKDKIETVEQTESHDAVEVQEDSPKKQSTTTTSKPKTTTQTSKNKKTTEASTKQAVPTTPKTTQETNTVSISAEALSSKPATPTEKVPSETTAATSANMPSESASDLLAAGKRAVKSFNYNSALNYFTKAANLGNNEAYFQLGMLYNNSNFDGCNIDRAISFMQKAAQGGNVEAMYQVGMLYMGRDNVVAKSWLRKAASNGHSKARTALDRFTN